MTKEKELISTNIAYLKQLLALEFTPATQFDIISLIKRLEYELSRKP